MSRARFPAAPAIQPAPRVTAVRPAAPAAAGLAEVLIVWALCLAMVVAVFITYARVDPGELYHVGQDGLAGGASRVLIVVNFPIAIIAPALLAITAARLLAHPWSAQPGRRQAVIGVALVALALCAVTAWPGVVTQDALDAKPINALPALGVGLVLALTLVTIKVAGVGAAAPLDRWDVVRLVLCAVVIAVSLPWLLADLGFYIGDVPLLGAPYVSKELIPAGATLPAVHLGHHHGADGALVVVSAIVLTRALPSIPGRRLRGLLTFALALMTVYGGAILANDAWDEQVEKRGWTEVGIPSVLFPKVTPAWGVVIAASVVLYLVMARALRRLPVADEPAGPSGIH